MQWIKEEILEQILNEDAAKFLLQATQITKEHNGLSYEMIRKDLALLAMDEYASHAPVDDKLLEEYELWKLQNNWEWLVYEKVAKGKLRWWQPGMTTREYKTTQQLYQLFLQSKQ